MLDVLVLMSAAEVAIAAGDTDPRGWFETEEWLRTLQEIADDASSDKIWTYCPTSYNPVAPQATGKYTTLLPQLVWVGLPERFVEAAVRLNCSATDFSASAAPLA